MSDTARARAPGRTQRARARPRGARRPGGHTAYAVAGTYIPRTGVEYVVDARILWNSISEGPTGYTAYSHTGWGAKQGERQKRDSWRESIDRRRDMSAGDVEFVPFSIEAGGVWGPAAKKFFRECLALADDDRDIDLYLSAGGM